MDVAGHGKAENGYKLRATGLDRVLLEEVDKGKLLLGICLGMQLLFERSYEYGEHAGLGLLEGSVVPMEGRLPGELKIPHIGWNALRYTRPHPLFREVEEGSCVYFVHSFFVEETAPSIVATAEYGVNVGRRRRRRTLWAASSTRRRAAAWA